jgi:hypothetical protein
MRFQPDSDHWDLISSVYLSLTSCMISNWVNGDLSLFISSVYWSQLIGRFWVSWIVGKLTTPVFLYPS